MLEQSKQIQLGHTKLVLSLHLCLPRHSRAMSYHPPHVGTQRQPPHFCSKSCIPQGDPCTSGRSPGRTHRSLQGWWAFTSIWSSVGLFALSSETQVAGEGPRPWTGPAAPGLLWLPSAVPPYLIPCHSVTPATFLFATERIPSAQRASPSPTNRGLIYRELWFCGVFLRLSSLENQKVIFFSL